MSKSNGSFMDFDFGRFADVEKVFGTFKLPMVDNGAMVEAQRKNVEALTEANKLVVEGWQAIAQRQSEIVRNAAGDFTSAVRDMTKDGDSVASRLAKQTDLVKQGFEQAVANARELTELGVKSQGEAANLLSHRFIESLDEIKSAFEKQAKAR